MVGLRGSHDTIALSQEDWKQPLLCGECEHLIATRYERFLNEILYLRRLRKPIFKSVRQITLWGSTNNFALALLSIFWRGAVSDLPQFRLTIAPDYVLEDLRLWILSNSIPSDWNKFVTIRVKEVCDLQGQRLEALLPAFHRASEGQHEFVFVCGGYMFCFGIPVPPNHRFSRSQELKAHSNVIRIERVPFNEVPEIKERIDVMLNAPIPDDVRIVLESEGLREAKRDAR